MAVLELASASFAAGSEVEEVYTLRGGSSSTSRLDNN